MFENNPATYGIQSFWSVTEKSVTDCSNVDKNRNFDVRNHNFYPSESVSSSNVSIGSAEKH
jgi:hypothetical protein